jgi:hypothetical protein
VRPLLQRKAINIAYSECVFVTVGVQHEMHIRHIVFHSLFFDFIQNLCHSYIKTLILREKFTVRKISNFIFLYYNGPGTGFLAGRYLMVEQKAF